MKANAPLAVCREEPEGLKPREPPLGLGPPAPPGEQRPMNQFGAGGTANPAFLFPFSVPGSPEDACLHQLPPRQPLLWRGTAADFYISAELE